MLIPFTKLMQCAFIVAMLNAFSPDVAHAQEPSTRPALTVTVHTVNAAQITPGFWATGNIRAWHDASVSAQTNGLRLKALYADVGDRVKAGQMLAEFEDTTSRGDLTQAEARLRQAQASLDTAKRNADRIRKIRGSGAISQSEVDQALSGEKNAMADVTAAKAALQTQVQRSSYTKLLAPSDGVISVRNAVIGAVVNPGQEIFHLVVDNRLEWQAQLGMRNLMQVSEGMPVQVVLPNDRKVAGKVRQIGPTLDEQTRQGIVYVDLASDRQLRAGMFLRGRFELAPKQGLTVPRQALVLRDGFNFVFVLENDNKVAQTKVQIGGAANNTIEVTAGLRDGDRVVTQGAAFLNDQDTVRVVEAATQQPATGEIRESAPGGAPDSQTEAKASPAGN
ncbi:MAG TPA: efflux transporter periplasmic adaptor subunit [Advenella kashmirensis]|uniref:Efflux transporter periplasmic adaptor subunit n=1 Tax=Advenella kashmirensis TaxID=310575 RepID=A0A356LHL7_9BURK|nr:efflux transporter periplasmic adaptor subunit [Advenella kashmirensis]